MLALLFRHSLVIHIFLTVSSDMANGLYKIGTGFKQLSKNLGISGQIVIFMLSSDDLQEKDIAC